MHSAKKRKLLDPYKIIAVGIVSVLLLIAALTGTQVMLTKISLASDAMIDWQRQRLGPRDSLRVYWVGHSLMEAQVDTSEGKLRLLEMVGLMAKTRGLAYAMGDHTLWGAPLSLQWRGRPHSHARSVPEMAERRRLFETQAGSYDAIVLTETVPVGASMKYEYSSYYLQQFYCTLMEANPEARVYLYESWVHLQALSPYGNYPSPHLYDWRERMVQERLLWERLADEASTATIPKPGWLARLTAVFSSSAPTCKSHAPIFMVPVGTAMVELYDRLREPRPRDDFSLPDGRRLAFGDLFQNAYVDWPANWPLDKEAANTIDVQAVMAGLTLHHPNAEPDDIHPSQIGVYFTSLVHFATLYRRSPVGLSAFESVGERLAATLQHIAWEVVMNDERTGVRR